jgi:hypothetical protein
MNGSAAQIHADGEARVLIKSAYNFISIISTSGIFTKLYAEDLKFYTSLMSTDDSTSNSMQDVISLCGLN